MKAIDLINRVAEEVIDKRFSIWTKEAHLSNLNDGISTLLMVRPDLARKTLEVQVGAGQVRINLPEGAYKLLAVNHCNGYALQYIDINRLNQNYERWRMMSDSQPTNWTRNELDETSFFLFPAPESSCTVEFDCSKSIRVESESEVILLPDIYETMLFHYMVYRAYSKEGQQESQQIKAQSHYQAFQAALAGKSDADYQKEARIKSSERVLS